MPFRFARIAGIILLLLVSLPLPAAAMTPPFTCVAVNERVVIDAPPGYQRLVYPFDLTAFPDPVYALVTVSNRGSHTTGLMSLPDAEVASHLLAKPGHSITGRLFLVSNGVAGEFVLPGVRRARFDLTIHEICLFS